MADDSGIGCDSCERWVCNTVMCSGLPQQLLNAINDYSGDGIQFICMQCRISRQRSPTKSPQTQMMELISQLFQQVKGICTTLQGLTDKVTFLTSKPNPPPNPEPTSARPQPPIPPPSHPPNLKSTVQSFEMRSKRSESVRNAVILS